MGPHCFLLKRLLTPPEIALPALTTPFLVAVPALAMPFFSRVQSCSFIDLGAGHRRLSFACICTIRKN